MLDKSEYTIRPYTSNDNAALALMWNESDDQWPGTFNEGVPMTEERVRDWMDKESSLVRLVVEDKSDGCIVGFGSLWEDSGDKDTCYVHLLNVHPAHQKRSLARRMLTRMVDWATARGYHRLTIGTWPANLKSVPLYKKVGFSWIPDTDVHMENYIPDIRQLAVAQKFFERHDWYRTFKRELEQIEDDERHPATGEMKVYVYRWEEDGEFLEAVVDRWGQAVTGLDTNDFAAYAIVDESEPAQGIGYPVRWRVLNKQAEPLNVSVLASGESGIELDHRASFTLSAREERVIEAEFTCAVDAPRLEPDKEKAAPQIKTALVIGGKMLELGTGLRYHPAVEIGAEPEFPSLLPGRAQTIHLQLRNRTERPLRGALTIAPQEGLTLDWQRREFEIAAQGHAGLPLTVTCARAGAVPLLLTATFADGKRRVTAKAQRVPLLIAPLGGLAADINADHLVIENDFFRLTCRAKGGDCRVWNKALKRYDAWLLEEIGPPFDPWEFYEKQYDLELERGQGWAKATLTIQSGDMPGLTVIRQMTVTASALVAVRYRVVNNGHKARTFQVKPRLQLSDREAAQIALPRRERLVIERASEFPTTHGDFPQKPEGMAEQWVALSREGQVSGAIWNEDVVEHEYGWGRLDPYFAECRLEPQSAVEIGPFYLYVGPGDWRDVRRAWQRSTGKTTSLPAPPPESDKPHAFELRPAPLLALGAQIEAQIIANSVRERAMNGRVVIEAPEGWKANRAEFPVEALASGKPLDESLRLRATQDRIGAAEGCLRLETEQFDETRPFTVIRLGDEKAAVRVEENQELWSIANGRCAWEVAPAFHGGVIAWRETGSEANHLLTAFPRNGELGWLKPFLGGIWPMIMPAGDDDRGWPGKLHEEKFGAAPLQAADGRGLPWRGVQVTANLAREGFEGLRAEIAYLSLGGSNALKIVYRLINETGAYRRARLGLLAFMQVDGEHKNSVLHADGLQRKRTPHMAWSQVGSWGAVVNPATGRAMVAVGASGEKRVKLSDWGVDGGHIFYYNRVVLEPHGSHEMIAYLALVESLEEARRYRCLAANK